MAKQDISQKTLLIIVIAGFSLIVMIWWLKSRNEGFSPYRDTNGIPASYTNFGYLDQYSNKDWYEYNPWIYSSINYGPLIFKYERENNRYLENKRKLMMENLKGIPQ